MKHLEVHQNYSAAHHNFNFCLIASNAWYIQPDWEIDNGICNKPIMVHTQILIHKGNQEQGFQRCFPYGLYQKFSFVCGASLRASSPGSSDSRVGKGRRACSYISGIFPPISVKQKWARVLTSLLMPSLQINISHWLFRRRIFKFQRHNCKLPSFSRPAARVPRRACSQATVAQATYSKGSYAILKAHH